MKINYKWQLFTNEQKQNIHGHSSLPIQCSYCGKQFTRTRYQIENSLLSFNRLQTLPLFCCSEQCRSFMYERSEEIICKQCDKKFIRHTRSKGKFCTKSCAAKYNNEHKTHGYRRSKLEAWIEAQLKIDYPTLKILFNDKQIINSELDIYIPPLRLAFELNGIFHYEPIYTIKQFERSQNNDKQKMIKCYERGIELCVIDTSKQKNFTEKNSIPYYKIIKDLIDLNLNRSIQNNGGDGATCTPKGY